MENQMNEQTQIQEQTQSENNSQIATEQAVSLGKFKDVNALLSAYNSLQSEFTKRCQKVKELEAVISSSDKAEPPLKKQTELADAKANITEKDKEQIVKEYLSNVIGKKQKAVLLDGVGVGVKTQVSRPKTISDAGELAREILNKK